MSGVSSLGLWLEFGGVVKGHLGFMALRLWGYGVSTLGERWQ